MNENATQIIPYYKQPHVFTVINDDTWYEEEVYTPSATVDLPYSTVVVAGADKGIDNTFIKLSDLPTKKALFGSGNFKKYGQPSIQADQLFDGHTNVWFCRVLPDNATYSNMILLAHYRKGDELGDLDQPTGTKRLEIKFSVGYAMAPVAATGATSDAVIDAVARAYESSAPDASTGYMTVPICYIRSIGRGKYGNNYSVGIARDQAAETDYNVKMYKWALITNETITRVANVFSGSLFQTTRYQQSTLISDVLDQYDTGTCPIKVVPFEENWDKIYDFYQEIVQENYTYLSSINPSNAQLAELETAMNISEAHFDPLFGIQMGNAAGLQIPYYRNYTVKESGEYVEADMEVTNNADLPLHVTNWNTASIGSSVIVIADENNGGYRWRYTVIDIDGAGNIIYDDGIECNVDDDQYDGLNISNNTGISLYGGTDGDFDSVVVNGETRSPNEAEMKILLSREYVKAFHGEKDRKILSPARVALDFIFDANYNMTTDDIDTDDSIAGLFNNSTVLTDNDYRQLSIINNSALLDISDINVKKAMYDLNEFRNRNGNTLDPNLGAGCLLHLDCGIIANKNINSSSEIDAILTAVDGFQGRNTSIDLGCYDIYDPYTGRKETVTVSYFIAQRLVPHIMAYGLNKPFTYTFAELSAIQPNASMVEPYAMIRNSFRPDIDLIDWDVKERFFENRINYYVSRDEGRSVRRACQNTRQLDASALLEENNVRVLNALKKGLESACDSYLYNFNEPEIRKGFTDDQMTVYKPWIGDLVQDLNIEFSANEYEQGHMMMHCYCSVAFRDIIKRIILEINVQRPSY